MEKKDNGAFFRFRKNDRVGEAAAEEDEKFLFDCFVDNGDLEVLADCSAPQRIVVGRTGSGKSALLRILESREEHVIKLAPEHLALNYLSNSGVIRFFEEAGANLDLFYQLLWKHVLAVELVKQKYKITNESTQKSFLASLSQLFTKDKAKEQAIAYLRMWGENFWNETEYRVREITSRIENDLKSSISSDALMAKLEAGASHRLSEEEKLEVISRGARVVSQVQMKALADVLKLLADEIFNDSQEAYYITIDDLDTKWIDDSLKYKLIRALIETVKSFRQVRSVKIIVSLRLDLLQRVISATRDSGFQSEKYESLRLNLRWSEKELLTLIDRRIQHLVKQRYTSRAVPMKELFPSHIGKLRFEDYLMQQTLLRPRDAILFVNECIARASDKGQIGVQIVQDAEGTYSQKRVDSLHEEWGTIYPKIDSYLRIFSRRAVSIKVTELSEESIRSWVETDLLASSSDIADPVAKAASLCFLEEKISHFRFLLTLIDALYRVGAIGIKPDAASPEYWSFFSDHVPSEGTIKPSSTIRLHPVFWRAVGARPTV